MLSLKILLITISALVLLKCKAKDYCGSEYCNNSKQHTLCKYRVSATCKTCLRELAINNAYSIFSVLLQSEPASTCADYEKTVSSENERRAILDKLNGRRNKVASGEIRSLPPAASMMKLEWNNELATSAQRWADQCVKHSVPNIKDHCRDLEGVYVEQNVATIHGDAPGLTPMALVDIWYMELLNINSSILMRYAPSSETGHSHYDYFTQLVWESSQQVGCGGVKFKELLEDNTGVKYRTIYRLVCNFAPAGNRRNKAVYSSGTPCTKCPFDGGVCDQEFKALCSPSAKLTEKYEINDIGSYSANSMNSTIEDTLDVVTDADYLLDTTSTTAEPPSIDDNTTFDYFSHLFEFTKQMATFPTTKSSSCKEVEAVDNFIELLKKKLSSDSMIKELLTTGNNRSTDNTFNDEGVASFLNRIYSKNEPTTTKKAFESDYVNSTLLVDLIEAVIFRNGDSNSPTEAIKSFTPAMSAVRPGMVQAELGEIKKNKDFTGHYFFPEEEYEEASSETTESYYDNSNIPISDVALEIEELRLSPTTNDFLDDILESETATESTTTVNTLSSMNINLYKSGQNVMKKFLQNIAEQAHL